MKIQTEICCGSYDDALQADSLIINILSLTVKSLNLLKVSLVFLDMAMY